ncbi:uncharacterized protein LOC117122955 [Anneissia japonica]|uniref:uncharacterized protein LOC117122955 n=1 Tax=Anneissia japonica TaxID=1529436 RepID=UPI001425A52D|nr:uncharacterized protein LOC117122955 [Anneissia japonica]
MEMDQRLLDYQFHEQWSLTKKLAKPFDILLKQIDQHLKDETHKTFKEEGLLFKSYLYMSGIGGNVNKDKTKAIECLNEVVALLRTWEQSPEKDGFLSVAYALEAWIDIDRTESRLLGLKELYSKNKHDSRNRFEASLNFIKGYSLSRLGAHRYAECIFEFQEANNKNPESYEYLFSFALMTRRLYGCSNEVGKELEIMLREVLERKDDYLYAKVELADVINSNGNTSGATKMLKEITTALTNKEDLTPENMKIVGHAMKLYLKLDKCEEAEKTYKVAIASGQELHSFVLHQRAILAKKREQWAEYKIYLKKSLEKNPFNLYVNLEHTKQLLYPQKDIKNVESVFDNLLIKHGDDDIAFVRIMCDYGTMLMKKKDNRAYLRYDQAIDKAFKCCQCNPDQKSHRIKFYYEINLSVKICVQNLRCYWKDEIENPDKICKLAKLEYKLRNLHLASLYCKNALQMALDETLKSEITCILADINIGLSVDVASLAEVDKLLDSITPSADLNKLKGRLAFKKGLLYERGNFLGTMNEYVNAANYGDVDAIKRILTALEMMDTSNSKFFEMCAYTDTLIKKNCVDAARESLEKRFKFVLESATFGDLKRLRKQQFEMEKALLTQNGCPECNAAYVIQISRNLLNYAMNNLAKRYLPLNVNTDKTLDFFCVHRNFDKKQTEEKVRNKLEHSNWRNIDEELITFLAEIQPCTNPQDNNWIMAFMEFNNTDKHQKQNKQYGAYKVYPEDQGAQPGGYQDKEYYSIDLARTVCNKIPYILDNLNGFSLIF